jgi:hypothetical protein
MGPDLLKWPHRAAPRGGNLRGHGQHLQGGADVATLPRRERGRWASVPPAERFWDKVNKNGPTPPHRLELGPCWVWTTSTNNKGYGQLAVGKVDGRKKMRLSHRISWELHHGPVPPGLQVLHRCDNPPCVRPDHLFLGTQAQNMADCSAKGRMGPRNLVGERNPAAKLREADVRVIRQRLANGERQTAIAADYGVHFSTIGLIARGQKWGHVL